MAEAKGFIRNQVAWLELCGRVHRELLPEEDMPGLGYHVQGILKKEGWTEYPSKDEGTPANEVDVAIAVIRAHLGNKERKEAEADAKREQALRQIHEWQNRDAIPLKALALICHKWQHDRDVMRAIREAGFTNAKYMARAVDYFPEQFRIDNLEREAYEKLFALARLSVIEPGKWDGILTLDFSLDEVRSRVQRRLAELKPKQHARPLAEIVADLAERWQETGDINDVVVSACNHPSVVRILTRRKHDARK